MKTTRILTLILGLIFLSCNQNSSAAKTKTTIEQTKNLQQGDSLKDKEAIRNLIRQTLKWADSENSIELLPVLTDSQGSAYIGFDLSKHKSNLDKFRLTDLFAIEFVENYNQIILTLDKKLRNREFEEWLVGDLPTFRFANGANPWCNCQDIPYDNPNPWDYVEIEIIELNDDKAELIWKWGSLNLNMDSSWKEFSDRFRSVKENGIWKISYLQGFDFEEATKKDEL
ncbi:MAG: hypothetical protein FWC34_06860 [Bacteroidetes bacterium]|nr:hypothetical protein [Bacteroidota bacterium]MCL2302625.1 hypothetical protein [Lentimicrobiaceae bacterium]